MHSPEVQPNADKLSGVDGGHTKDAGGFGRFRRSGKCDYVVYVAAHTTTAHYFDNCAIKRGDHYRFDAATIRHPDLDAATIDRGAIAKSRTHRAAATGTGSDTEAANVYTVDTKVTLDDTLNWAWQ